METVQKNVKRLRLCLMLSVLALVLAHGMRCRAASSKVKAPSCVKSQTVYLTKTFSSNRKYYGKYYLGNDISCYIFIKNLSSSAEITNIKSSNKKITGYSGLDDMEGYKGTFHYISLSGTKCKPGETSTISFKVKQNGKTYKLSCKITLKLKPTVFTTFSIGSKNYASKMTGISNVGNAATISPVKGKLKIKMKTGIKLQTITLLRSDSNGNGVQKTLKNNSYVSLKKGDTIWIQYKYTKKPSNYNFKSNKIDYAFLYVLSLGGNTIINVK